VTAPLQTQQILTRFFTDTLLGSKGAQSRRPHHIFHED
jgi:hypothetical protein